MVSTLCFPPENRYKYSSYYSLSAHQKHAYKSGSAGFPFLPDHSRFHTVILIRLTPPALSQSHFFMQSPFILAAFIPYRPFSLSHFPDRYFPGASPAARPDRPHFPLPFPRKYFKGCSGSRRFPRPQAPDAPYQRYHDCKIHPHIWLPRNRCSPDAHVA